MKKGIAVGVLIMIILLTVGCGTQNTTEIPDSNSNIAEITNNTDNENMIAETSENDASKQEEAKSEEAKQEKAKQEEAKQEEAKQKLVNSEETKTEETLEEPPEITISIGEQNMDYVICPNDWDSVITKFAFTDTLDKIAEQNYFIPTFNLGNELGEENSRVVSIDFGSNVPDSVQVFDAMLDGNVYVPIV